MKLRCGQGYLMRMLTVENLWLRTSDDLGAPLALRPAVCYLKERLVKFQCSLVPRPIRLQWSRPSVQLEIGDRIRTIPNIADLLQPLEDAIRHKFIPSLTGQSALNCETRELMALPIRHGGPSTPLEITPITTNRHKDHSSSRLSNPGPISHIPSGGQSRTTQCH